MSSDRLVGLFFLLLSLAFFVGAGDLESPFFADPLGPKVFPRLISILGIFASLVLVLRPDAEPKWPNFSTFLRLIYSTLILVLYAYGLKHLGFLLPTALAASFLSYQISPNFLRAASTGIGLSVVLFIIFKFFLGLSLFALPRWLLG